jgi:hypothetical protein
VAIIQVAKRLGMEKAVIRSLISRSYSFKEKNDQINALLRDNGTEVDEG